MGFIPGFTGAAIALMLFSALVYASCRIERYITTRRHVRMFKAVLEDELRRRAFWA
jgi:hypothetical protein